MIEKIKNKRSHIKQLLTQYPSLRDNDIKLMKKVWSDEADVSLKSLSVYDMVDLIIKNKMTNPETIRRARQKIQENHPELRGESHNAKQELEKETRREIKRL